MNPVARLIQPLLDLLFPRRCLGCRKVGEFICPACAAAAPFVRNPTCLYCDHPDPDGALCYSCRHQPSYLTAAFALCYYQPPVDAAIRRLKYRGGQAIAPTLAHLAARRPHRWPIWLQRGAIDLFTPVPLHPTRLRQRGYNQSALLAAQLAAQLDLPYTDTVGLQRTRHTRPQVGLGMAERRSNVAGAFTCSGDEVQGKRVALLDDVYTTGATLQDCARALREAGATRVYAITIARARRYGVDARLR